MEVENEKLLPCPFCGSEVEIVQKGSKGLLLTCTKTDCNIIWYEQKVLNYSLEWLKAKMIERWNTRVSNPIK